MRQLLNCRLLLVRPIRDLNPRTELTTYPLGYQNILKKREMMNNYVFNLLFRSKCKHIVFSFLILLILACLQFLTNHFYQRTDERELSGRREERRSGVVEINEMRAGKTMRVCSKTDFLSLILPKPTRLYGFYLSNYSRQNFK